MVSPEETPEEPARIVEEQFEDPNLGREVRVIREVQGALGSTYLEIQDEDGVWRDVDELVELHLDC